MIKLITEKRENIGKNANALREKGFVPAVLYGRGIDSMTIAVSAKELNKAIAEAGESSILSLVVDKEIYPVLIHDYDRKSLTGEVLSVDFYKVKMDEKITINVPVEFIGESQAVKDFGGVLVKALEEIEVEALPADLPHEVEVDISNIKEVDHSVYVRDTKTKGKFEIITEADAVLATVVAGGEEMEETGPTSVSKVVVESEEKKASEETEK